MIYLENMGYLWEKLWDILGLTMGNIGLRLYVIFRDIVGKHYRIYWAKIMGYIRVSID